MAMTIEDNILTRIRDLIQIEPIYSAGKTPTASPCPLDDESGNPMCNSIPNTSSTVHPTVEAGVEFIDIIGKNFSRAQSARETPFHLTPPIVLPLLLCLILPIMLSSKRLKPLV